jgi:GT2 family glycosyltransferase
LTGAESLPDVSVVVLAFENLDVIGPCLESLAAVPADLIDLEVIVIDNASQDGTAELVRECWPGFRLIVNGSNVGLTRGRNQGIKASRGRYVLFLDSDARLGPGCLEALFERLESDPRAGAAGPRLVYGDGGWQRWTAGRELTLRTAANYLFFLERLFPGNRRFAGLFLGQDTRSPFQPDWVCGACLLIRREVFDQVGVFPTDSALTSYVDDVDICRRMREAGWTVWYCAEVDAVHLAHSTWVGTASRAPIRSLNGYFAERRSLWATIALRCIEALGFGARALVYLAAWPWSRQPRHRAMATAHWTSFKASLERVPDAG